MGMTDRNEGTQVLNRKTLVASQRIQSPWLIVLPACFNDVSPVHASTRGCACDTNEHTVPGYWTQWRTGMFYVRMSGICMIFDVIKYVYLDTLVSNAEDAQHEHRDTLYSYICQNICMSVGALYSDI